MRLAVVLAAGCFHPTASTDQPCAASGACPTGQHCELAQSPPVCVGDNAGPPGDAPIDQGESRDAADAVVPVTGVLTAAPVTLANGDVNLTAEGTLDWVHWGLTSVTSVDRKVAAGIIGDETFVGTDTRKMANQVALTSSWTDGKPDVTESKTPTAIAVVSPGGMTFAVPASKTKSVLHVYIGLKDATAKLDLALSDGSAPAYHDTQTTSQAQVAHLRYDVTFAAGGDGEQLAITLTDTDDNATDGLVELINATLE